MAPRDAHILTSGHWTLTGHGTVDSGHWTLTGKRDFLDVVKGLEMGRFPWILWVGRIESLEFFFFFFNFIGV